MFQSKADKWGGSSCISILPLETSHSTREDLEQLGNWLLPVLSGSAAGVLIMMIAALPT
jgi:hypothetical protein